MAKNQTRKSISVNVNVYQTLKVYCEVNNLSMSGFVEDCVQDRLGQITKPTRGRFPVCSPARELGAPTKAPVEPEPVSPEIEPSEPEAPQVDPKVVAALHRLASPVVTIKNPCRREGCGIMALHEAESCR